MAQYLIRYRTRGRLRPGQTVIHAKNVETAVRKVLQDRRAHPTSHVRVIRMRRVEHGGYSYFEIFNAGDYYYSKTDILNSLLKQESDFNARAEAAKDEEAKDGV